MFILNLRELPALNDNFDPAQPWTCRTPEAHDCDGVVVGAHGAYPVCLEGAKSEQAAREAHSAEINAWLASPAGRRAMAVEAAMERHQRRYA